MKANRTVLVILAVVAAIVVATLLSRQKNVETEKGGPGAPPDIIILQPTKPPGNTTYWTIGTSDAIPVAETENYINSNAVGLVAMFRAKIGPNTVTLNRLVASFKHCSVTMTTACEADSECPQGESCATSTIRVQKSGSPASFQWTLTKPDGSEVPLVTHDYGNPRKWRAELCGKLVGPARVTYLDNNDKELSADLTDSEGCKIEKK